MSFKLLEINIRKRMFSLQDKTKKRGGGLSYTTAQTYSESSIMGHMGAYLEGTRKGRMEGRRENLEIHRK